MSKKETPAERLARMKQEREAVKDQSGTEELVSQLAHESGTEPDLADITAKLKERQAAETVPSFDERTVKTTIYIDADVAEAFDALCLKRGDKQRFATQALREFCIKKSKELGL